MKNEKLPEQQKKIVRFIRVYQDSHGYPPAVSEIATEIKAQPTIIREQLKVLENKGYIQLTPNQARAIKILMNESGEKVRVEVVKK